MSIYVGVDTKARHIKQIYIGIGGKARRVSKAYLGVGGKARLFYSSLSQLVADIPTTVGQTCTWAGHNWTIAHITDDLIYMILTNIYSKSSFCASTLEVKTYANSRLISKCDDFLTTIPSEYQAVMAEVTVNSVTKKVFVPAHGMVCNNSPEPYLGAKDGTENYKASSTYGDGTKAYPIFSLFNIRYDTNYAKRIATYNGSADSWLCSTPCGGYAIHGVNQNGHAGVTLTCNSSYGFRPCIAVKRRF